MNQVLVNRGCDELNEFRIRNTENTFIRDIIFKSTKSLSRAEVKDFTLVYDGPKTADLIKTLLPTLCSNEINHDSKSTITHANKSSNSIPENAQVVDVLSEGLNMTCLKFDQILQIHCENKNLYALCPFGCMPEEKVKPRVKAVNPMNLHRYCSQLKIWLITKYSNDYLQLPQPIHAGLVSFYL